MTGFRPDNEIDTTGSDIISKKSSSHSDITKCCREARPFRAPLDVLVPGIPGSPMV